MEGLFLVIAITIAIVNLFQKQNQNQKKGHSGTKKQPSMMGQNPIQQWMENLQQPDRTVRDMKNPRREGSESAEVYLSASMLSEYNEGIEIEDRSRTGSLGHMEQSQSSEGICNEHPEHAQRKKNERKVVPKAEVMESEEDDIFDLTEKSLLRSIVMAEVLGPPRAMKRRIR